MSSLTTQAKFAIALIFITALHALVLLATVYVWILNGTLFPWFAKHPDRLGAFVGIGTMWLFATLFTGVGSSVYGWTKDE